MSSLFDIGKSGLNSYRQALAVTGQNIANIDTDGYKRRGVQLEEVSSGNSGVNSIGNSTGLGVRVDQIRRSFDEFLLNKVRTATAQAEATVSFLENASQLQDIIVPGESNLGSAIGQFFAGLQEVSTNPSELSVRTLALENARQMADIFVETAVQLNHFKDGLEIRAAQQLDQVNILTSELAQINLKLSTASGTQPNNALLDARDAVIDKLSEYVEVVVSLDRKGAAKLTLGASGNGPLLVGIDKSTNLGVSQEMDKLSFVLEPEADRTPTAQITGGSVMGLSSAFSVANDILSDIDHLAFKLTRETNAVHREGMNLDGELGGDLFASIEVNLKASPTNSNNISAEIEVLDYGLIDERRLTFSFDEERGVWTGRDDFGRPIASGQDSILLPGAIIRFLGDPKQFDQFTLNPSSGTAAGMSVAIQRPDDFAAASPLLVTADPGNDSSAIVATVPMNSAKPAALPTIKKVFSNNLSSIAATEFLTGGAVATIPANVENLEILSLASQSQAQFLLTETDLGQLNTLKLELSVPASEGSLLTDEITFDLNFANVRGFTGKWLDAGTISELMNLGVISGTVTATGQQVTLAELGGFASGKEGNLHFSLSKSSFASAEVGTAAGTSVGAVISAANNVASDVHIFTREGRHISGPVLSEDMQRAYEALMTVENGFHVGAEYVATYRNEASGQRYLETEVTAAKEDMMNVNIHQTLLTSTAKFEVFEGVDTNEKSVNGLSSVAQSAEYSMAVGGLTGRVSASELNEPSGDAVAAAMIASMRSNAPIASVVGTTADPLEGDKVAISFENQIYTITMRDGEPVVSGGEVGRLSAFFDSESQLHIVSDGGSISKSSFALHLSNNDTENPSAARRFGLTDSDGSFAKTIYSDVDHKIEIPGHASGNNVIELTFNQDDIYRLKFVFDDTPDSGSTASIDKEIGIGNVVVSGGNAQAVADAINDALANNSTDGDGGANLNGVASAVAVGNKVTLTIAGSESVTISALGSSVADGDGTVTVHPITTGASVGVISDSSDYDGLDFDLRREGSSIVAFSTDGAAAPVISASSASLAKQRYGLTNLPNEELIIFVGEEGAKRVTMQYDEAPESVATPHRDTSIRIVDAAKGIIEAFDVETNTSILTRTLDDEQSAQLLGMEIAFEGKLATDDIFLIAENSLGKGDSTNLERLLSLQLDDRAKTGKGGFQSIFNTAVVRLGALVSSGRVAADAAEALKGASLEAESAYSGVNLDVEASNLIEQQQAYQASARVLSTAREIFDTLLQSL